KKAIEMGADYVLLGGMNDTIVDSEFITALVDTAEKNPRSITLPKVYVHDNPKRLSFAGGDINWLKGGPTIIGAGKIDTGQYDLQCDIKHGGLGILVNTSFFGDVGMMDFKSFPMYWGDTDFTYRAYKKGYRIIYEPKSRMWHKVCSTVKKDASSNPTSFLSALIYLTTNIRSTQNFRTVIKFHLRYCPLYLIPYVLMRYALRVIIGSMLHSSFFRGVIDKTIHR
ncbi:MAG: glycosyltransferase family 2 protein, partial [Methanophagales archaeon]|nr:glycosyltransferase family 2 protein [Methanophagales archaeon]